ncbi:MULTISPECIES: putative quinol monooxygenase [Priestia]|uniref:putative quinol monooxygenase n=1 Tax=Priestia TaxID=2800373 RepID=UPI0014556486|nr:MULTISPECIES: putative quinol monooxygenase [Priestia]MBY0007505.1 antibiotic biosynthesis monooxygenase [Priestia aryabhattai]MBY0045030.1 antibiotic biosynthesis monooxygenase [Priestia aryabhattai]MED3951280.1 putative quinol monooxygenase [Priestia aryabhattai]NLR42666.1 antibiotic biosynthesis monooxygenase [Priestia megaterium]WDC89933.1 putative quinol monooxygenase [Priestia megaterium]
MSEIIINAILQAKPGKEEELRSELVKVIEPSREEKGCIQYTLHQDTDKAGTFVFYEKWKSKEDVEAHIETPHYQQYRQQTEPLIESRAVHRLQEVS